MTEFFHSAGRHPWSQRGCVVMYVGLFLSRFQESGITSVFLLTMSVLASIARSRWEKPVLFFSNVVFGVSPLPRSKSRCVVVALTCQVSAPAPVCRYGACKPSLPGEERGSSSPSALPRSHCPPAGLCGKRSSLSPCPPAGAPDGASASISWPCLAVLVSLPPRPVILHVHLRREGILGCHLCKLKE